MQNPFVNDSIDIFLRLFENWRMQSNSISVGKIVKVNTNPISADIQPLVKWFDRVEGWRDSEILREIPIAQFGSEVFNVRFPLNIDDLGIILWMDKEIYTLLENNTPKTTIPDSGDSDDLNACIFLPFLQLFTKAKTLNSLGMDFVSQEKSLLTELISSIQDIKTALGNIKTFSQSVASSPTSDLGAYATGVANACSVLSSDIDSISENFNQIQENFETFKGQQ